MSDDTVRDAVAKVEKNNNRLVGMGIFTLTCLLLLAVLTLIYVIQINQGLKSEFEAHRKQSESNIKQIQGENEDSHQRLLSFVSCLLKVKPEERSPELVDQCIEEVTVEQFENSQDESNNSGSSSSTIPNNTPNPDPEQQSISQPTQPAPVPQQRQQSSRTSEPTPADPPDPEPAEPGILEQITAPIRRFLP